MHIHSLEQWQHSHNFLDDRNQAERRTKIVMWLTAVTMIAEIIAGTIFGSMALLSDGWHMATHVAAFGITIFTYQYARSHATDPQYTFGTGKVSVLGGFASAVALAVIAAVMAIESMARLFQPQNIQFNEAIGVAVIGLVINLVSAGLLQDHHDHSHEYHHDHPHEHHNNHSYEHHYHEHYDRSDHAKHHDHADHPDHANHPDHADHNLRAAYLHVLADALTSILAIAALCFGRFLGWIWMDALMGLVGAGVITKWAYGLVRDTSAILLDGAIDKRIKSDILTAIEADADNRVTDLHIWQISQNHLAATISLVTHYPQTAAHYKSLLAQIPSLSHVVVEVNHCSGEPCVKMRS